MNTCFKLLVICLFLFTLSCKKDIESKITITGNSKELINNTIYLKEYNHFNYLNKSYILDSTMVDSLGNFQFSIKADSPELITISKYSLPPLSYQVFKETPNIYYYSFCANFFANEPCLYIDTKKNYSITHWDTKNLDSSIIFNNENQNLLRNYYRTIDYRGLVTDENRQPLSISATEAWDIILEEKEKRIKDFKGYMVDKKMMKLAHKKAIFLHCLPAYREYEVSTEVFEKYAPNIFAEAENRLHAQKAIMVWLDKKRDEK